MFEKEIKILEVNKEELIKKLEELGAIKTFEDTVCDTYYDYANAKMEDKKRLFRIRTK
jgi:adenylate cyclase class IV